LREHLADSFHLLLTDNRGVGRSDAPWPPYSTSQLADDHAAILDDAGIGRTHVFGISLGGMIAQQIALRHGARVERLVLGCTTHGGPRAVRYPARGIAGLLRAAASPVDQAMRMTAPTVLSAEALASRPEIVEDWIAIARSEPRRPRGLLGQLLAAARHDTWAALPALKMPTLVVTGDADRLIVPENSRRIAARIAGAKLTMIAGAGHDFPSERPEETATILREFLLT
jgi:pimeloyl-ACP methyl ester carboxylesterase